MTQDSTQSQDKTTEEEFKSPQTLREEAILHFWDTQRIFEKTLAKESPKGEFVFYDGPPYATGMPHYGHLLPSTIKDAIPRYKTMQGFHVSRKWGWDCHGLPIENLIEKELGLQDKKAIIDYGIDKFNKAARDSVFKYDKEWKTVIHRLGRFVDMDNAYHTMDPSYTESVWWSFKALHDKGLVYEGFKVMQVCPRCETTLSNFEVGLGYKDVSDLSVYALFELADSPHDGQIKTFVLAWTTTPWTLHGNVALAINPELKYVKVRMKSPTSQDSDSKDIYVILAESRLSILKDPYEIIDTVIGADLVGLSYKPVFDTYSKSGAEFPIKDHEARRANAWKIYGAEFVTADDGTGVVHIAPGYGDDDYKLGEKNNLPVIQHIGINGRARTELGEPFADQVVKSKGDNSTYDINVIKSLAHAGLLFAKEKIMHSYPHCWRCDTPLINLATSAWFIEVTKLQNKFIEQNNSVNWIPETIGKGRFGSWLENLRDWNISRARFWGAPLPVWRGEKTGAITVIGSIANLANYVPKRNTFTIMRHGESTSNTLGVISSNVLNEHGLTEKGQGEAQHSAKVLSEKYSASNKKITKIYASDFRRTRETAEIMAAALGVEKDQIVFDSRLRECKAGEFDGGTWADHWAFFANRYEKMFKSAPKGESIADVKRRITEFLYEIDANNENEEILIVTHGLPLRMIMQTSLGRTARDLVRIGWSDESDATASLHDLNWKSLPHNDSFEIDIHRPYVDQVSWTHPETGERMIRVPDVFDVWYDSGSMPFAQAHYPFENKDTFEANGGGLFPADFISEGLDQTRGWFYSLLALGVGLFDAVPYKNVVVNGLILAEDGRKMSKSLQNYPDLWPTIQKFGADSLRYFLTTSPAVHGEGVAFTEKALDEVNKKVFNRLENIYSFLVMYTDGIDDVGRALSQDEIDKNLSKVKHPLDIWVLAKLNQLIVDVTESLDKYLIDKATRPIGEFIDEVSTWYLRRSRDRFKSDDVSDKDSAIFVTRFVLEQLALIMNPVTPFIAEHMYQKVKTNNTLSASLASWPKTFTFGDGTYSNIISDMQVVRDLVERGLAERSAVKIKARQPLASATYTLADSDTVLSSELEEIIQDELNVKSMIKGQGAVESNTVVLDTNITDSLKKEGFIREIIRAIQQERKNKDLVPQDLITVTFAATANQFAVIEEFANMIKETVSAKDVSLASLVDGVGQVTVPFLDGDVSFVISL